MTQILESVKVTPDEKVALEFYRRAKLLKFAELEYQIQDGKAVSVKLIEKHKIP